MQQATRRALSLLWAVPLPKKFKTCVTVIDSKHVKLPGEWITLLYGNCDK